MAKPETITQAAIKKLLPRPLSRIVGDRYKHHRSDYVVVSFPKCGRTWLRVMLSTYFTEIYGLGEYETLGFENLHSKNPLIPRIYFTHDESYKARPEELSQDKSRYRDKKTLYLVRDPRDVVVSLYFHRTRRDRDLDSPLIDFVLGKQGGLNTIIEFYNTWARALPGMSQALMVRYESLRADPVTGLQQLLEFMDQPVDRDVIKEVIEETSFARMKERERTGSYDRGLLRAKDTDDSESFKVRRGKVGGYVDYFSPEEVARIDAIVSQTLSPVFGY